MGAFCVNQVLGARFITALPVLVLFNCCTRISFFLNLNGEKLPELYFGSRSMIFFTDPGPAKSLGTDRIWIGNPGIKFYACQTCSLKLESPPLWQGPLPTCAPRRPVPRSGGSWWSPHLSAGRKGRQSRGWWPALWSEKAQRSTQIKRSAHLSGKRK